MHEITPSGRHRGAARYNPAAELSTIVKSAGQTGIKVTAVLAASGGLVAAFALPAQAATPAAVSTVSTADTTAGVQALTSAPGVQALALAPAVVAPAAASPAMTDVVGVSGVTAVAKPKPKPKPKPTPAPAVRAVSARAEQSATASRSSRSTSPARSSSTSSTQATAPAPSRTVPAGTSGVVNIARTLLGIAYVYGGTTPAGFDCSGLTQYVFAKAGRSIPRTASAQQRAATPVSNPQPGDLVFYGSPAWHVGIYTGNGMMIDSPRPGKFSSERKMFSGVTGYGRF
ncbi:MAG: C40 family peptidase [Ornithinibacter sp.]